MNTFTKCAVCILHVCTTFTYKKEDSVIQSSNACILCLLTPAVPCCSMHRGGLYQFSFRSLKHNKTVFCTISAKCCGKSDKLQGLVQNLIQVYKKIKLSVDTAQTAKRGNSNDSISLASFHDKYIHTIKSQAVHCLSQQHTQGFLGYLAFMKENFDA